MSRISQPVDWLDNYLDKLEKNYKRGERLENKFDISSKLHRWRVGPEKWRRMHEPLKIPLSNSTRDALRYGPPTRGPGGMRIYRIR